MNLSTDLLDAIKNKTYHLRPVKIAENKRRRNSPSEDFKIAQILARRIAMGYGGVEEEDKSDNSLGSINSGDSFDSSCSIQSNNSNIIIKTSKSMKIANNIKSVFSTRNTK